MTTQTELLREALKEAFMEGYTRCSTYNDIEVSDVETEWEKAAPSLLALAQPEQPAPAVLTREQQEDQRFFDRLASPTPPQASQSEASLMTNRADEEMRRAEHYKERALKAEEQLAAMQAEAAKPADEAPGFMQQIKAAKGSVAAWEPWMQVAAVTASTPVAPGAEKPEAELHGKIHGHDAKATFPAWHEPERAELIRNFETYRAAVLEWLPVIARMDKTVDETRAIVCLNVLLNISAEVAALLSADSKDAGEPVAWVRRHPDGALTAEFLEDAVIEPVRKKSGAWVPLYIRPQAADAHLLTEEVLRMIANAGATWLENFKVNGPPYLSEESDRGRFIELLAANGIAGKDNAS